MAQMNLSTKQKETRGYRNQTCCQGGGGRGRAGAGDRGQQMEAIIDTEWINIRVLQHRELHSISCDKL